MTKAEKYSIDLISKKQAERPDFAQGFDAAMDREALRRQVLRLHDPFVDHEGKVHKYSASGRVYGLFMKLDGQKRLVACALLERVAMPKAEKTDLAALFADSEDILRQAGFYYLPGHEVQAERLREAVFKDLHQAVGFGEVKEAQWGEARVQRTKEVQLGQRVLSRGVVFLAMFALWSLVFHNAGLGLCFAVAISGGLFTAVTGSNNVTVQEEARASADAEKAEE